MNSEAVAKYLVKWLRDKVGEAGAEGVVLGISGGIDSAVAGAIAKEAFPENCMGLLLPCESKISDIVHSQLFVEKFNITYQVVELDGAYNLLLKQFEAFFKLEGKKGKLLKANIKPRLRMLSLYYFAQAQNYLVLGTSNKSEMSVGYATKYGDSGVDLQILGDLHKDEVYELAHYYKVPDSIINKAPSGGLWEGQTDEGEMGIAYEELDKYLREKQGEPKVVERITAMIKSSEHKRNLAPIAVIPGK